MNKFKILIIGGLMLLTALPGFASNGNPRIPSTNAGIDNALVFCGAAPYQDDDATNVPAGLYLLGMPNDYEIDKLAYPGYAKYWVKKTPVETNYGNILLKSAGKYAVVPFTLGSPAGPADEPINTVTWYDAGVPELASDITVEAGYETARATWKVNKAKICNYSIFEITVVKKADGTTVNAIVNGVPTSPTVLSGGARSYAFGELIDGRKLESGTKYEVMIVGKVQKKAVKSGDPIDYYASAPGAAAFTTLSGGAGAKFTINIKRTMVSGLGINSFSVPMAVTTVGGTNTPLDGTSITTAYDLCDFINKFYGASKSLVRSFGTWDETAQLESGATISYSAPGVIDGASSTALKAINLQAGRGYQVFVKPDVDADVSLTFTLQ
ncbi:MAG: hypothetical protein PHG97_01795 [Candidatus Margulisbacteria bacterium]|nr:hypothetical protein [Candidatus Margulisiibacteriota bacterium]